MSLATGYTWTHKNIRLIGYSMAGISTSLVFPDADACFDVAQGLPFQMGVSNLLITHGHMDHASGLPYVIAQKAMQGQLPPTIYMPESLVRPISQVMRIWQEIDQHTYQFQLRAALPGIEYPLKGPYFFRTFRTVHRVDSHGYTIFERKKRLKPEYRDLGPLQLGDLRRQGATLEDTYEEAVLSFTGDTTIEFLDTPEAKSSRVLVMEVTYWDDKKSVENAREWGHIHLDEVLPRLESLASGKVEKILLIHASARYTTARLKEIMDDRIPEHFKHKVDLFPRPI